MEYYNTYNPIADFCTLGILLILYIVIKSSFYSKSKKNKWMVHAIISLFMATFFNIIYMFLIEYFGNAYLGVVYVLRCLTDFLLLVTLHVFSIYLISLFEKNTKIDKLFKILGGCILMTCSCLIFTSQFTHFGLYIENNAMHHPGYFLDPFAIGYILFLTLLFFEIVRYSKNILLKALRAMVVSFIFAEAIMIYESLLNETTYLCFTYLIPIVVVFVLFHSNSYDLSTGTLDRTALNELIDDSCKRNVDFYLFSLNFVGNKDVDEFLNTINSELHHFYDKFFIHPYTFRISERRFILVCKKIKLNKKSEKNTIDIFEKDFKKLYLKYEMKYKLFGMKSISLFKSIDQYLNYIKYIEGQVKDNTLKFVQLDNMAEYFKYESILNELKDINEKRNLDDERVLVYAQPIFNTKTNKVTSAESLMRLNLNGQIVYPDEFIPVAEKNNLIHFLSLIILNKVCKYINDISKIYEIERISVNFSTLEFSVPNFFNDIKFIITKSKISYDKIGIELTESQTIESDDFVYNIINNLSNLGMKLYLDDFGTGYSNFERIMTLPFDIIKYDKSLLDNSIKNKKFRFLIEGLSKICKDLGYTILFEGVETEKDGKYCTEKLNATYLQGFYYSRPIPIENLKDYLDKK